MSRRWRRAPPIRHRRDALAVCSPVDAKGRQGTRAATEAEGRERRVRRAGVGQAPRRRGVGRARRGVDRRQAREDRQERAGLRAGRGQHLDGRLDQAARRAGARAPPQHLQQHAVGEDIQSPDVRRPVAVHEAARVEGEEAAREFCESIHQPPRAPGWDEEGRQTQSERRYGRAGELEERLHKISARADVRCQKYSRQHRRERQKQMLRAAEQGKQRARLDVVAPP